MPVPPLRKVTEFPAATAVEATDLVPIVRNPAGAAATERATWQQIAESTAFAGFTTLTASATAPVSPDEDDLWIDSSDYTLYVRQGSAWVEVTQAGAVFSVANARVLHVVQYNDGWPETRPAVAAGEAVWWLADIPGVPAPPDALDVDVVTLIADPQTVIVWGPAEGPRPDHIGPVFFPANNPNAVTGDYVWMED